MNRRAFLKSILAAGVAPYVSTMAGVLMPVRQPLLSARFVGSRRVIFHRETSAYQFDVEGKLELVCKNAPRFGTIRNVRFFGRALGGDLLLELTR